MEEAAMIETYYHLTMHTLNYDSCTEARRAHQLRDAELAEERRREQKERRVRKTRLSRWMRSG